MHDTQVHAFLLSPVDDLEETAGIAGSNDVSASGFDVLDFSLEQLVRHFGLNDVVDARAAAAPRRFGELDEF